MEKGRLRGAYGVYVGFDASGSFWFPKHERVKVFVCRKCGFIELYREKEDSAK